MKEKTLEQGSRTEQEGLHGRTRKKKRKRGERNKSWKTKTEQNRSKERTDKRTDEGRKEVEGFTDLHVITQRLQRVIYQSNQRHYRHSAKAGEYVSGPLAVIRSNHE